MSPQRRPVGTNSVGNQPHESRERRLDQQRGLSCKQVLRDLLPSQRPPHPSLATATAREAGPREHGRQAARSTRDRPGGHASRTTGSAPSAPPSGGVLDPVQANSAMHDCDTL